IGPEHARYRDGQILYTYFHMAAAPDLAPALLEKHVAAVAYETIELTDRSLPLLRPMSEVAGRMAIQVGASCLQKEHGGKGVLLPGVPGVKRGRVTIIGGGIVGTNAAKVAVGMGAKVTILDRDLDRLVYLDDIFGSRAQLLYSDPATLEEAVTHADLVVGAVLVTGAKAPKLVTRAMLGRMEPGSVIVDVSVDQGGCIETCRATTHADPTFVVDGVVHYCVANMPGAVARTSTYALTNATIGYAVKIADAGIAAAARALPEIGRGLNTYKGRMTHPAVAAALGYEHTPVEKLL
ncbi:MAG: alanine dehydrogenase, partial [Deltaproteobacteria bacterium]|nr:alanine dehydrogenase [Deltaproteobacteria bacterium]